MLITGYRLKKLEIPLCHFIFLNMEIIQNDPVSGQCITSDTPSPGISHHELPAFDKHHRVHLALDHIFSLIFVIGAAPSGGEHNGSGKRKTADWCYLHGGLGILSEKF